MNEINQELLSEAVAAFSFPGTVSGVKRYGNGHINDTYCVQLDPAPGVPSRFILQRINSAVFKKPREVMENIEQVTGFLRNKIMENGGDYLRETLNLLHAKDGRPYWVDPDGEYWRVYWYISNTTSYQTVESKEDFYQSARSFGNFQRLLADYPADTLHETIVNFHNTVDRLRQLRESVDKDSCGRVATAQPEIDFALARADDCGYLLELQEAGKLPLRVTHNDTKLNNILIDNITGTGICVIDLDTVMPGLSLYDFGDSIRFGATYAAEDEQDLSKVKLEPELFQVYTKGYLEVAGSSLTDPEIECLPWGAKLMTLECGIRFLADYLNGDIYFKIHREAHNLDRARTQFKLVEDMERQWKVMGEIVKRCR